VIRSTRSSPAAHLLGDRLANRGDPEAPILLDVRDPAVFAAGHLPGSGNLPEAEWEVRRSELPPPESPVLVIADSAARALGAARMLESLGYPRALALEADVGTLDAARDLSPAWPLWRPTPCLVGALERFGDLVPPGPAADLASGAGRDAVFLALLGLEVEAWDRAPEALARAGELARTCGVRIATVECDLERNRPPLPVAHYALLTCFRFLDRPLLGRMRAALAPGGILVYETYLRGQERFGKPKRAQFLLAPGELEAAFAGLEILDREELAPPHGPITARIVARRGRSEPPSHA
jgi:rhodanese-related sulfurtransferase